MARPAREGCWQLAKLDGVYDMMVNDSSFVCLLYAISSRPTVAIVTVVVVRNQAHVALLPGRVRKSLLTASSPEWPAKRARAPCGGGDAGTHLISRARSAQGPCTLTAPCVFALRGPLARLPLRYRHEQRPGRGTRQHAQAGHIRKVVARPLPSPRSRRRTGPAAIVVVLVGEYHAVVDVLGRVFGAGEHLVGPDLGAEKVAFVVTFAQFLGGRAGDGLGDFGGGLLGFVSFFSFFLFLLTWWACGV